MLRRITTILCVIVLAVMTAADSGRAEEEWGQELLREEFHQSYPLPADGRISLHNINGAVRIAGWDRSEVKVDAVKRATTRERLDEAMIEINASGDRLDIRTRYPEERWREHKGVRNPASVEYTLTIPRGARLEAVELINGALDIEGLTGEVNGSSINGRVAARGLTGPVKLSTINGLLEAEFAQLGERVSLNSVNGQVALVVPSDANAQIKASTVHGSISNSLGLPVRRGRFVGTNLAGQLGTGGPRVSLSNVNGTINVRRASDGRQPSPAVNQLEPAADSEGVVSEVEIEREVAREVEREMRAAQR
ncbi:MAG: DUF4097 family beta strand repeat-containing protein, partial [Pyrinomonadaceae bacterium]